MTDARSIFAVTDGDAFDVGDVFSVPPTTFTLRIVFELRCEVLDRNIQQHMLTGLVEKRWGGSFANARTLNEIGTYLLAVWRPERCSPDVAAETASHAARDRARTLLASLKSVVEDLEIALR